MTDEEKIAAFDALPVVQVTEVKTYRGWSIECDPKPIPSRDCDWTATHPDYDASYEGPEDGWVASHPVLYAATEAEVRAEIDDWFFQNCEQCDEDGRIWNNADPTSGQWVPCDCGGAA